MNEKTAAPQKSGSIVALRTRVIPALAFGAALALSLIAVSMEDDRLAARERLELAEKLSSVRSAVELRIGASTQVLLGLKAFVLTSGDHSDGKFETFAANIMASVPELRSIQLAPGGVVSQVYPRRGNEAAMGHRILEDPKTAPIAKSAIDSKATRLAGPYRLLQGYDGLVARMPIFRETGEFWGFATAVIDFGRFAREAGLPPPGMEVALSGKDGHGAEGERFFGAERVMTEAEERVEITVPGGRWTLHARGGYGSIHPRPTLPLYAASFATALLVGILAAVAGNRSVKLSGEVAERERREERLVKFERIVSCTPDMMSLVDRNHRYEFANGAYATLFGKQADEMEGMSVEDLVGTQIYLSVSKPSLDRAFSGKIARRETWIDTPNAGRRYFQTTYHPVPSSGGEILSVAINARDITDLKTTMEERERILDLAPDLFCVIGLDGYIRETNEYWRKGMAIETTSLSGRSFADLAHPDDARAASGAMDSLRRGAPVSDLQARCKAGDGSWHWLSWNLQADLPNGLAYAFARDITETRALMENLRELAVTDQLTGASTRRAFWERAATEIPRAKRRGAPLAVVMLDVDHFKRVNDTFGHAAGDEALKAVSALCLRERRAEDAFARIGGEEFAYLLPDTGLAMAESLAERVRSGIAGLETRHGETRIPLTASLGVAALETADERIDDILKKADLALYEAKAAGRNAVRTHPKLSTK